MPDPGIDKYIRIERPGERIIIVNLGYDAITAINSEQGIVVFDAGISTALSIKYRKIIEKEFGRKDFAYLINTHSHADHVGGNRVFSDARIIGQENCPEEFARSSNDPERIEFNLLKIAEDYDKELQLLDSGSDDWIDVYCQKARYQCAYNDLREGISIPDWDKTFSDSMNVSLGDISLKMIYVGYAHSESDIIILVPELKLLMVGDLFFPGGRPSVGTLGKPDYEKLGKTISWIKLHWNDFELVIGGHGQIMSKDDLSAFIRKCGLR